MRIELGGPADESVLREAFRIVVERHTAFCLVVSDGISERIFYFALGGLRVIAAGPRREPSIGRQLVEMGIVSPEQHAHVEASVGGDARRWAEAAVQLGVCSADVVEDAVVRQVEEELLDVFFWDGAELSLVEGQPPKSFYEGRFQTAAITCDVAALLDAVVARVDVWKQTVQRIPAGRDVYEATDRAAEDAAGPFGALVGLLDGTRTVADAVEAANVRRVPAFEYLMLAIRDGKVRRTVGSAAARVTREQLLRDVGLLEEALRHRFDASIVRRRLARTLEQAGEPSRAAARWRELGDIERKRNDLDGALAHYAECVRVLPTDFGTRELILEIYRHRSDHAQVVAHGRPLAELFLKHNLLNRAKGLLQQLVAMEPTDAGFRRNLVLVLIGLGERDLALRHLRELAKLLEGRKAPVVELRDVHVRTLALDPSDRHARKRLDEITGVALRRRILTGTVAATAAAACAIVGLSAVEWRARTQVRHAVEDARGMLDARDFDAARDRLLLASADTKSFFGATRPVDAFLDRLGRIDLERAERAKRRSLLLGGSEESREEAARRRRSEDEASGLAAGAERLAQQGRTAEAHRLFKELFALHGSTRAAAEAKVPLALTALPADARISVNGSEVGQGAAMLSYRPSVASVVEIDREGFEPARITLDGLQPAEMTVSLHPPLLWTAAFDADVDAEPLLLGGSVFVAGRDRFLTALSASDGSVLWRTPLGLYGDAGAAPVSACGLVVLGTAAGEAVALEPATGRVAWRADLGSPLQRPLALLGSTLVAAPSDGRVVALSATDGKTLWEAPAGSVADGAPFVLPPDEFAWVDPRGSLETRTLSGARSAGRPPVGAVLHGTPAPAADDRLWVLSEDEKLRLVAAKSGTELRSFTVLRVRPGQTPVVAGDTAYVTLDDGHVVGFRADGETALRTRLDQPSRAGLCVSKGKVYVGGAAGRLTVLDAATGRELWRFETGSPITARPVVADGTVLVANSAGRLFAIRE